MTPLERRIDRLEAEVAPEEPPLLVELVTEAEEANLPALPEWRPGARVSRIVLCGF